MSLHKIIRTYFDKTYYKMKKKMVSMMKKMKLIRENIEDLCNLREEMQGEERHHYNNKGFLLEKG